MPLEKQSLNNFLPDGFETLNQEGYKTNFSEDKIKTGYEKDIKDRVSGPNLNNLIDVVGKNTNTLNNYVEYLNGMPINNVPTVNTNGQLDYMNLDDKLTKKQITNCILEIPQRIKLELNNGTLTLKAGSQVIVPNGFKDDGTTPKFDYVTVESDLTISASGGGNTPCMIFYNATDKNIYYEAVSKVASGTTSIDDGTYYHTDTNLIDTTNSLGGIKNSLPLCLCGRTSSVITSIDQTFNGFGYIGSTAFVLPNVKGLIPNGRNEDGTLNNIEYTTDKVFTRTMPTANDNIHIGVFLDRNDIGTFPDRLLNPNWNIENYITNTSGETSAVLLFATATTTAGVISNFNPKQPFRAVDYKDVDGQWVAKTMYLVQGATSTHLTMTPSQKRTFDLSEYLPKDNNLYEVIVSGSIMTGTTSGNHLNLFVGSAFIENINLSRCVTRTSATAFSSGNCVVIVGGDRKLYVEASVGSSGTNTIDFLKIVAYRKVI